MAGYRFGVRRSVASEFIRIILAATPNSGGMGNCDGGNTAGEHGEQIVRIGNFEGGNTAGEHEEQLVRIRNFECWSIAGEHGEQLVCKLDPPSPNKTNSTPT